MEAGISLPNNNAPRIPSQVFFPTGYQELFTIWNRFPDAVPYAGGTNMIRNEGSRTPVLPRRLLCLDKMEELKKIARTEKYLEIGAMVRLNRILSLGKIVPPILSKTIEGIAGVLVRNLATIGGNLCYPDFRLDTTAPMIALDARYELRSASSSRWISALRFSGHEDGLALNNHEILTRIRIPLDEWNYSLYRKFKPLSNDTIGGVMVFLLKIQKNTLSDLRIIYTRNTVLHNRDSETFLIGKRLPLLKKDVNIFLDKWRQYLDEMSDTLSKYWYTYEKFSINQVSAQIMAFLENAILEISD